MSVKFNLENADRVGKAYLINYLVSEKGQTYADATESVNGVLDAIVKALAAGVNVSLSNIGTFRAEVAAPTTCYNPHTEKRFAVDAQNVVRWTSSPTLTALINGRIDRDSLATKAPKGSL